MVLLSFHILFQGLFSLLTRWNTGREEREQDLYLCIWSVFLDCIFLILKIINMSPRATEQF